MSESCSIIERAQVLSSLVLQNMRPPHRGRRISIVFQRSPIEPRRHLPSAQQMSVTARNKYCATRYSRCRACRGATGSFLTDNIKSLPYAFGPVAVDGGNRMRGGFVRGRWIPDLLRDEASVGGGAVEIVFASLLGLASQRSSSITICCSPSDSRQRIRDLPRTSSAAKAVAAPAGLRDRSAGRVCIR